MTTVKILLSGSARLRDMLFSPSDGGANPRGLRELVTERHGSSAVLDLEHEASAGASELLKTLSEANNAIVSSAPGLIVMSVDCELDRPASVDEVDRYQNDMLELIRSVKSQPGSHIIVLNASTIDPGRVVSNYQLESEEPLSLRAHRYDLAVMRLSFEEGISIVDVDRILAERGASGNVMAFQDYSPAAREAIASELVRIMDDYGFFDDRQLLPQVGREE